MFYIFHGDDTHSQKETLNELLARLGDSSILDLNTTRFDGPPTMDELRQASDAIPFLSQARVVIVKDALSTKNNRAFVDDLIEYLPHLPVSTRLVFQESRKLSANNRLLKLARQMENGHERVFTRPVGHQLYLWINDCVIQKGGLISPQAAHLLAANVGSDLPTLDNEIEKLVMYKGLGNEIGAPDVLLLSPYVAEKNIFDLVDAFGSKELKKAAALLHAKLAEGTDPFFLFSMFARQIRLLIQVKELADAGEPPPQISRRLNLHSYVAGKLTQQCQGFQMAELEAIHRHLLEVDVAVKSGRNEMVTALHLLVAGETPASQRG